MTSPYTTTGSTYTPINYQTNPIMAMANNISSQNLAAQPQPQRFCSQFNGIPCNEPEPFASMTDILTASQLVENAIHAPDINTTTNYLNMAMVWLQHAYNYFVTAQQPTLQARTQQVMNTLTGVINGLQTTSNLQTYQNNTIYGFMGVLSALYQQINSSQ